MTADLGLYPPKSAWEVRVLCNFVAINLTGLSLSSLQTKYTWTYTLCRWRRCRGSTSDHDAPCHTCDTSTYTAYMLIKAIREP